MFGDEADERPTKRRKGVYYKPITSRAVLRKARVNVSAARWPTCTCGTHD